MEENTKKENNGEMNIELGDKIHIFGGRFNNTRGRIYYLDETLIRILPDGVSDRLIDLEIDDGYLKEEYEIENLYIIAKRKNPSFVVQQDYRVGQLAESFKGFEGVPVSKYVIVNVNEKEDSIVLKDSSNEEFSLEFNFKGIPLDFGIDVLRSREIPVMPDENALEDEAAEREALDQEEEIDFGEEETVEVTMMGEIKEIESSERIYPDNVQRSDMLQDFISKLDIKSQKNPNKIKEIRRLIELCILLRNELIHYEKNGVPFKKKETSFDTLLDLVVSPNNMLSRGVMDVKRTLYLDVDESKEFDGNVDIRSLKKQIQSEMEYSRTEFVGNQQVVVGDFLPNWYTGWEKYNKDYFRSFITKSKNSITQLTVDKDLLRVNYPDDNESKNVDGLPKVPYPIEGKDAVPITEEFVSSVYLSVLRVLGPRVGRLRAKEDPRILESADDTVIDSYLLFPKVYERELGTIRSGKLAYDINHSMYSPRLLESIFKKHNGVSMIPNAGSILAVGNRESETGNIVIEDWIKNLPIVLYGLGDALVELRSYGFGQKEFSYEQQKALLYKIDENIAHVISHIQYIRKKASEQIATLSFENKNLLNQESYEVCMDLLNSEPIMKQFVGLIQRRIPFYKNSDVAIFAGLNSYAQDLLLATLASYPQNIARYRNDFVNKQFVEGLRESMLVKIKMDEKQFEPEENRCVHVRSLNSIRKVKDSEQRMQLIAKFITQYQSYKKDNFIYCIVCDKHCLCEHEYLLLQEYLHPREKDTIHKELLLKFSGGVFQGKFICQNCGQAIADLDFDTSLEYDDEGKPMMGRSELVDKDAQEQEEIDLVLGAPTSSSQELQFESPAKTLYYQKARELFDSVGIFPNPQSYIRIINGVDASVLRRPSREQYIEIEKKKAKQQKGVKVLDYDVYINRIVVSAILAYSIVEVQTYIPNYIPRFSSQGCVADFRGYPLGKETDKRIIEYFACTSSGIIVRYMSRADDKKINDPWRLCGFGEERNEKKRQDILVKYIEGLLKEILVLADVQALLSKKKEYLLEVYGKSEQSEGLQEIIPHGFTPTMYDSTDEIIVSEAANKYEKVRGYILSTHKEAKDSIIKEMSPLVERTCCVHNLQNPNGFWANKDLPMLPEKEVPRGPINSHSKFLFNLRRDQKFEFNVSESDYYKIFLKVCFQGPRVGLFHEFGYNKICPHCDFKAPENIELQGEAYLKEQNIEINNSAFNKLLDAIHLRNSVSKDPKINIEVGNEILQTLYNITPAPFEEWRTLLNETLMELMKLDTKAESEDFAVAYGKISNTAIQSLEILKGFIGERELSTLESILDQPIAQTLESINISIILPLSRVLNGYNLEQLSLPNTYDLDGYIKEDINKFLKLHTQFIESLKDKLGTTFAKSKISYALKQLSVFIHTLQNKVRIPLVLGGKIGLPYIMKAGIVNILKDMVDPNVISPENFNDNTTLDTTSRVPILVLKELLIKYKSERFKLTDEDIRIEIAKRDEKEKMLIISKLDRMTKEEKALELVKKRLGIGDWAVGGTKAIYAYNPDQYERDRNQRMDMGLVDFSGDGTVEIPEGRQADAYGFYGNGDEHFYEANGAYEVQQTREDDY
uniref:Uncharacterized protein n=1 Tax=viral metagenome TaxID=1070528 RepID=A0A6C0D6W6_9ZZZZ